jgi:hypothetical protein
MTTILCGNGFANFLFQPFLVIYEISAAVIMAYSLMPLAANECIWYENFLASSIRGKSF